jgi:hypothetical protein
MPARMGGWPADKSRQRGLTRYGSALVFCDQLANFRDEVDGNVHNGLGRLDAGFVLQERVLFRLILVEGQDFFYFVFVPPCWKFGLFHCCFFLLRLRSAVNGLPVSSNAVMTKTLSGWGSGT